MSWTARFRVWNSSYKCKQSPVPQPTPTPHPHIFTYIYTYILHLGSFFITNYNIFGIFFIERDMELVSMCCLFAFISSSLVLFHFVFKLFALGVHKSLLPPGTLGWPYIGETFQLYSQNPSVFFASKVKKLVPPNSQLC